MKTAVLVTLCLVMLPAAVLAFATSQPAPRPNVRAAVRRAVRQDIAYMKRMGYVHISCAAQARDSGIMCSANDPRRADVTIYVLGTVDIP